MRRVFTAIDISEDIRRMAGLYIDGLRGEFPKHRVRWESCGKLHLTVRFIGDINDKQLETVIKIMDRVVEPIHSFQLTIEGTGVFPSVRKPRILWLGVEDENGSVDRLKKSIEAELENAGFPGEKRLLKPHLTIARINETGIAAAALASKHRESHIEPVAFDVSQITVYESKLLPAGSVYSVISRHRLQ